ncbi:MAG: DUF6474 family protein [Sciscionella sp.]
MVRSKQTPTKINPSSARNALGVAKVLGPTVLPVLAPIAAQAAGRARESYDRLRARKLGVPLDKLGEFSGRGGALHARIAGSLTAVTENAAREGHSTQDEEFAATARVTLGKLAAAVRAAEHMPAGRRRAAHRAVVAELDRLDAALLGRLGV